MRIAYVSADRGIPVFGPKGASIHIQEMMRAFTALGHEVRCVCARKGAAPAGPLKVEEIAPPPASGTDRAAKEQAAMAQSASIGDRLLTLHSEWPFDLIYERYSLWSASGVRAGALLGVPVLTEVNAPLVLEQAAWRELVHVDEARTIEAEVFGASDILALVSAQVAGYALNRGAPPGRAHVIGNAVDTRRFHPGIPPATLSGIPDDAFVVGFTGSLKAWHGVDTLMRAFRSFHSDHPDAHLLVVGDGPKRGWITGFAEGAGLASSVTVTGWVDHARLPELVARMDVATAPYPEADDHYFSPLKLYEYLAMGRPVLASRIGQTAELLHGSEAALLLPPGDAAALAGALRDLQAAPDRRARMAAAAAAEGRRHDWRENARRALALVDRRRRAA